MYKLIGPGPYEFLDKELQQIIRDGDIGTRLVDKLAKVWLKNGEEHWVLLHVDVQGEPQEQFGLRMYVYNFRIFDRYGRRVASFAILADDKSDWRPDRFGYNLLGCNIDFRFPTVKLLDFVGREAELEANPNPFAVVVLAFLSARQTANDDDRRKMSKIRLIRSLYDRGLERKDVERLFRLIHWFMVLPEKMEEEVWHEVEKIEQEKHVQNITPLEKIWLRNGVAQGRAEARAETRASMEFAIETLLETKFDSVTAATLMKNVHALDASLLPKFMLSIKSARAPEDLTRALDELVEPPAN